MFTMRQFSELGLYRLVFSSIILIFLVQYGRLSWLSGSFKRTINIISYRVV